MRECYLAYVGNIGGPASQTIWEAKRYFLISEVLRDGRLVKHARYDWLLLAESHLTRRLFGSKVRRIGALAVATG